MPSSAGRAVTHHAQRRARWAARVTADPRRVPGETTLRSYLPVRVPPHRATSDVLAGAYPFLAEAGLGDHGVFIGHDVWSGAAFCFDPWVLYERGVLTDPNCVLAGILGRGKSTLAKAIATRSIAFGRKVYVPGDPKGEWAVVARTVGGQSIQLGGGLSTRLNPLDEGPRPAGMPDPDWSAAVCARRADLLRAVAETALDRTLRPVESTALSAALVASSLCRIPVLPRVVDMLFNLRVQ